MVQSDSESFILVVSAKSSELLLVSSGAVGLSTASNVSGGVLSILGKLKHSSASLNSWSVERSTADVVGSDGLGVVDDCCAIQNYCQFTKRKCENAADGLQGRYMTEMKQHWNYLQLQVVIDCEGFGASADWLSTYSIQRNWESEMTPTYGAWWDCIHLNALQKWPIWYMFIYGIAQNKCTPKFAEIGQRSVVGIVFHLGIVDIFFFCSRISCRYQLCASNSGIYISFTSVAVTVQNRDIRAANDKQNTTIAFDAYIWEFKINGHNSLRSGKQFLFNCSALGAIFDTNIPVIWFNIQLP